MTDLQGLVELIAAPISADAPGGSFARYEAEYEALKDEIDKLSSPSSAGEADWNRVVDLSRAILGKTSKDLLVASYLCAALLRTDGYAGLAAGLEGTSRLVDELWPALFPEAHKQKARVAAFEWLAERLAIAVRGRAAAPDEAQALERCAAALDRLDGDLDQKLSGAGPSFRDLLGALRERAAEAAPAAPEPEPAPVPAPAVTTQPVAVQRAAAAPAAPAPVYEAPPAASEADLASSAGREEALKDTLAGLKSLASALRRGDPKLPLAYKLARVAAWGRVRALPPHTDGRTRVPNNGANPQLAQRLEGLAARGEWEALLEQCEAPFPQSVLWLDLQRLALRALEGLGAEYAAARRVVRTELEELLSAFPALLDLRFDNDAPFASDETRAWAHATILAPAPAAAPSAPRAAASAGDQDAQFEETLNEARDLARDGRAVDGFALLAAAVASASSRRRAFARRLAAGRLMLELREARLALAQAEALDEDLRCHGLDVWEPALAADALGLLLACHRALPRGGDGKSSPDSARRADEAFARLARIDPAAAFGFKG